MSYSILVVGSAALDTIETYQTKVEDCIGGSALYFAAAASLFTPVAVVAVVGKDFPIDQIHFLRQRGVDLSGLNIVEGLTFRWGGRYDRDFTHRETLFTALNTFETFNPIIPQHLRKSDLLFLGNILPELQLFVLKQMEKPKFVLLDTIRLWIENERKALLDVIAKVDAIVLNDEEIRLLTDYSNINKAVKSIFKLGPKLVIVKRGENGATLHTNQNDFFALPAYPLEEVEDPTGAGDSFAGGFLGKLAQIEQLNLFAFKQALLAGTVVASYTVQSFGLQRLSTITLQDLQIRTDYLLQSILISR
ncbi:MAG: PfkB family carbohydrate kinase [bacterium]|nr:PfkB family carbohydrate kinase [bacterium]